MLHLFDTSVVRHFICSTLHLFDTSQVRQFVEQVRCRTSEVSNKWGVTDRGGGGTFSMVGELDPSPHPPIATCLLLLLRQNFLRRLRRRK